MEYDRNMLMEYIFRFLRQNKVRILLQNIYSSLETEYDKNIHSEYVILLQRQNIVIPYYIPRRERARTE